MSIAEQLTTIAENVPKVYEAGQKSEYDRFWDSYQQNGNRTRYRYAFSGDGWNKENLKPKYPILFPQEATVNTRNCLGMFAYCNQSQTNDVIDWKELNLDIDFSNCSSVANLFLNSLINNIDIDISNAINIEGLFNHADTGNNAFLTEIKLKISEKCTNARNAFIYCTNLTNLSFHEGSCLACNLDIHWSPLTIESVLSVLTALTKDPTLASGKTATFKSSLRTAIEADPQCAEQIALAVNAGWTIGYA